tara:strand:- start:729 stop:953 length:225 start_codon:yes stop_codon:yes gene_type:complete
MKFYELTYSERKELLGNCVADREWYNSDGNFAGREMMERLGLPVEEDEEFVEFMAKYGINIMLYDEDTIPQGEA